MRMNVPLNDLAESAPRSGEFGWNGFGFHFELKMRLWQGGICENSPPGSHQRVTEEGQESSVDF